MMIKILLALLLFLINLAEIKACQCYSSLIDLPVQEMGLTQTESEKLSSFSDLIFNGSLILISKVIDKRKDAFGYETEETKLELTFKVHRNYRGEMKDTLKIRTNYGSDACGFGAQLNTDCIIFAHKSNGIYYTYRSDCCKSISKEYEPKRYEKYLKFFNVIIDKIDGNYIFYQTASYWNGGYVNDKDTLKAMQFSIKNGKFEGEWVIIDRLERILEHGKFKNGKRNGVWKILSFKESKYPQASDEIKTETIYFKKGYKKEYGSVIEDKGYNWEILDFDKDGSNFYFTLRKQILKNGKPILIEYFDKNGNKLTNSVK